MKKLFILAFISVFTACWASGTLQGSSLALVSQDIVIEYADLGGAASINAKSNGVNVIDWTNTVLEINGLYQSSVNVADGFYGDQHPGTPKPFKFVYRNRSNKDETVNFSHSLTQTDRWSSVVNQTQALVPEDSLVDFTVSVDAKNGVNSAKALELTTLNIAVSLDMPRLVTQYTVFENVVSHDMQNAAYGGTNNITHQYTLRAEDFNIVLSKRLVNVDSPTQYQTAGFPEDDLVPGAKIRFSIAVHNNGKAVAYDVQVRDKIPQKCHMYFTDTPVVENDYTGSGGYDWTVSDFSPANNTADPGTEVLFDKITIGPESTVTLSYSVTVD